MRHRWTLDTTRHLSSLDRYMKIRLVQGGDLEDCAPIFAHPDAYEDATLPAPPQEPETLLDQDLERAGEGLVGAEK